MKRALPGLLVFVVALALRLLYVQQHHDILGLDVSQLTQTDNYVFATWAADIADGDWLCRDQPHAFHHWTKEVAPESRWDEWYGGRSTYHQAPLYPYVVATIYRFLGREHLMVGYVQALLGALTCWLTFVLASRTVSPRAGFFAGMLLACSAPFYFYDAFILRDGFMALMVVLATLALDAAVRSGRLLHWFLAGASLGLFTLAKETGLPLLALTVLGLVVWLRHDRRRLVACAAVLLLGWGLVTAPAFARNVAVGAPTFKLSTRGPEVLIAGNARGQSGSSWDPPVTLMRHILMESNFSMLGSGLLTVATHRADPWGFVELLWSKTVAYLNGYEVPNNVNFYLHRAHLPALRWGFVSTTFLAPAALMGLLLGLRRRRQLVVPYLMFGAISASVIALYILARFRLQALPLFALFAGLTLDWAVTNLATGRRGRVVAALVPFALLTAWCWPSTDATEAFNDRTKNATIMLSLAKVGNFPQAMRYRDVMFAQSIDDDDTLDETARDKLQRIDDAFDAFERSMALGDDDPQHFLELGDGYTALLPITKRADLEDFTDLARRAYQRALALDPEVVGAHHGLGRVALELARHWQFGRVDVDYGPALHEFLLELSLHPEHGPTRRDAGLIHFGWGQVAEALQDFLLAERAGAADAQVLAGVAAISINSMYADLRPVRVDGEAVPIVDTKRGIAYAERALAMAPDDPAVMDQASKALYVAQRFDEALALIDRLAAAQPWRKAELQARSDAYRRFQRTLAERERAQQAATQDDAAGSSDPDAESTPPDGAATGAAGSAASDGAEGASGPDASGSPASNESP